VSDASVPMPPLTVENGFTYSAQRRIGKPDLAAAVARLPLLCDLTKVVGYVR
jgi:hypothetical protein